MLKTVIEYPGQCLRQVKSRVHRILKLRGTSLHKLWLMLISLVLTLIVLLNIRLDIGERSAHRKIYHSRSLAKVIINRLSKRLNIAVNTEKDGVERDADSNDDDDYYGIKDGQFVWNGKYRPWFMTNGTIRPDPMNQMYSELTMWPDDFETTATDRIVNQLMFIPFGYDPKTLRKVGLTKKVYIDFEPSAWGGNDLPMGEKIFLDNGCPVNTCELVHDGHPRKADAVLFKDLYPRDGLKKQHNQIWIVYILESPLNTPKFRKLNNLVNWTATFRHDSEIVTPYEKFIPFSNSFQSQKEAVNFATGKAKKVAWFVSNCASQNNRLEYAKELAKHIEVDIFGRCGSKKCPRSNSNQCLEMLSKEYKFYLAFENSDCRDYITEKFFVNGLATNILPIVKGAGLSDYLRSSPKNSFIHVDQFKSPKELAHFLEVLDKNDTLYNEYFKWKNTGEFINTRFWCRLCAMLHAPKKIRHYSNLNGWWHSAKMCKAPDN